MKRSKHWGRFGVVAWGALVCLGWLGMTGPASAESNTLSLGIGAQKVLTVPGISRVAVGNPSVADVKTIGSSQILVVGEGEGRTTLLVWKTSGQRQSYVISVRRQDPTEVMGEIRKLLGEIEGVTVRQVGDRVYLDGQAYTSQDADRIDQIANLYPNVTSFVKVTPNAKKLVAQNLTAAFQRAGLRNVEANLIGSTVLLEGTVESEEDLQKAELIVKAAGEKVESLLKVGIKRMILSEVQFVEIRRQTRDRIGVKYPTDITGSVDGLVSVTKELLPGNAAASLFQGSLSSSADYALGFQMNDGYGRLLAQPKLLCASGEKAEFLAGGEIPIPLITQNQISILYKQYGVILKIRPTADARGNIQTEIEAEASELDTSVAVSVGGNVGVPGFRTRKVNTNVTVRHGETIVLSGVFSHDEQKSVSKVPGLGHLPIIGELFKNRAFDNSKRELVIFVTPRIVNPESDRVRDLIEDVKSRYIQAKGEVNFNIFD